MSYQENKKRYNLLLVAMIILLFAEIVVFTAVGAADIPFSDAVKAVLSKVPLIKNIIDVQFIKESHIIIITNLRLPRVILAATVGAALAVAGASFQGVFRNPLADPYIIGATAGGALGAAVAIVIRSSFKGLGFSLVTVFAFLGSLTSTYVVYMLGKVKGKVSVTAIVLSGIALNAMLSAMLSMMLMFNNEKMEQIMSWTMGNLSWAGWDQVIAVLPGVAIGITVIIIYSKDMNIMLLGEESAQHLGVNTNILKKVLMFTGALITGLAVSVSGTISFVGIIVPHIIRMIMGPDNRILVPFSAVGGAVFLIAADGLARSLIPPAEIPVGILTAAIGGPFFIYLLLKSKKKLI